MSAINGNTCASRMVDLFDGLGVKLTIKGQCCYNCCLYITDNDTLVTRHSQHTR